MLNYSKINKYLISLLAIFSILFIWMLYVSHGFDFMYLISRALIAPQKTGMIVVDGIGYEFILPKKSILIEDNGRYQKYFTLTSGTKLFENYYHHELPDSGWKFVDQLGSGYFYEKGNVSLISTRRGVFHRAEELTFSINVKGNEAEKVVAVNH